MELNKRLEELENNACDIVIQNEPIPNKPMLKCKGFLGKGAVIKAYSDLKYGFYLDDDELYDIFTRFNFNEQLIQVEIDQLMREMKKGKEYQWHDPNEKTKEPAKEKKTTHDKQGKKEYVNKYKNNYGSNYYYQNQKNYTYNNNYYNRNYNKD